MDYPKFIVSNQKEEFINLQWVKYFRTQTYQIVSEASLEYHSSTLHLTL